MMILCSCLFMPKHLEQLAFQKKHNKANTRTGTVLQHVHVFTQGSFPSSMGAVLQHVHVQFFYTGGLFPLCYATGGC
jgi:hypothetical protein